MNAAAKKFPQPADPLEAELERLLAMEPDHETADEYARDACAASHDTTDNNEADYG